LYLRAGDYATSREASNEMIERSQRIHEPNLLPFEQDRTGANIISILDVADDLF
jgi:hypothetical protein